MENVTISVEPIDLLEATRVVLSRGRTSCRRQTSPGVVVLTVTGERGIQASARFVSTTEHFTFRPCSVPTEPCAKVRASADEWKRVVLLRSASITDLWYEGVLDVSEFPTWRRDYATFFSLLREGTGRPLL